MRVNVFRSDPAVATGGEFESFEVPVGPRWTAMDLLDYIAENLDSSLAYYRHSACDHGICGRCALKINGKVQLACSFEVSSVERLTIEPARPEVVRDLVVRQK